MTKNSNIYRLVIKDENYCKVVAKRINENFFKVNGYLTKQKKKKKFQNLTWFMKNIVRNGRTKRKLRNVYN